MRGDKLRIDLDGFLEVGDGFLVLVVLQQLRSGVELVDGAVRRGKIERGNHARVQQVLPHLLALLLFFRVRTLLQHHLPEIESGKRRTEIVPTAHVDKRDGIVRRV